MSDKRKANFVLGFSWGHENDRYKRIRKACTLVMSYFVSWSRQACKADVGKTDVRRSPVPKRKNQTQIDIGCFLLWKRFTVLESGSCIFRIYRKNYTGKYSAELSVPPIGIRSPKLFWFSTMGGFVPSSAFRMNKQQIFWFVGAGLLHASCKWSIENIQSMRACVHSKKVV